jgi:isoleucyl-tRNA synthetase
LYASGDYHAMLSSFADDLRFVFITSRATVHDGSVPDAAQASSFEGIGINVSPSAQRKCERCWHYRSDVGADPAHADICGRCTANLYGSGEPRVYA